MTLKYSAKQDFNKDLCVAVYTDETFKTGWSLNADINNYKIMQKSVEIIVNYITNECFNDFICKKEKKTYKKTKRKRFHKSIILMQKQYIHSI